MAGILCATVIGSMAATPVLVTNTLDSTLAQEGIESRATAKPLAEMYVYKHGAVSGLSPLDSTVDHAAIKTHMKSAGYGANAYTGTTAYYVLRTMANDAIFHISAHANEGRMSIYTSANGKERISANAVNDDSVYSLEHNF